MYTVVYNWIPNIRTLNAKQLVCTVDHQSSYDGHQRNEKQIKIVDHSILLFPPQRRSSRRNYEQGHHWLSAAPRQYTQTCVSSFRNDKKEPISSLCTIGPIGYLSGELSKLVNNVSAYLSSELRLGIPLTLGRVIEEEICKRVDHLPCFRSKSCCIFAHLVTVHGERGSRRWASCVLDETLNTLLRPLPTVRLIYAMSLLL